MQVGKVQGGQGDPGSGNPKQKESSSVRYRTHFDNRNNGKSQKQEGKSVEVGKIQIGQRHHTKEKNKKVEKHFLRQV